MIREKYTERIKEISLNVTQSRVNSVRQKDITKTGIRIYRDGYIGCAGAIGSFNDEELENKAIAALDNRIPYSFNPSENLTKQVSYYNEILPDNTIVEEIDTLLSIIRESQPEFTFNNKINFRESEITLTNDKGLNLSYRDKYMFLDLVFKENTSINIIDGYVDIIGRKYDREEIVSYLNEVCDAYKNKVELPREGIMPVVFSTFDSTPLMKFITDLDGNRFGTNSSLFSGKLNEKLFNENFSLYQTNNPEDLAEHFFDAEGTINEDYRYALIDKGVLTAPYTDKRTASKYNLPLTGSAFAEYDGAPRLGMPNLMIKESEKTAKELLNGEMGIYVLIASGGDFTPEGNYGTPVQVPFLFDGEKLIGRLPELNISSNVFEMFGNDFVGVSKNTINSLSNSKYLIMNMKVTKL